MTSQNVAVRRVVCLGLLVVALASCDNLAGAQPKVPQGTVGDVAREMSAIVAPNAEITDRPFEELIASLDLAKTHGAGADAIVDQIRKSRAGATAARTSALMARGSRFASVAAQVTTFSIPHFANEMAFSLDPLTKSAGTRTFPLAPYSGREENEKTFTTTTLSVTEVFTSNKSHVNGNVRWGYTSITIEKQGGATLVHIKDDRELTGDIDVCPDASGGVPGKLHVTSAIVAQSGGVTTTRNSTGDSTFLGQVDEQATLRTVTQQSKIEASWESASGQAGYRSTTSATWNANANGYLNGLDVGSIGATVETSGVAAATDAAKAAGWGTALDAYALEASYIKAQELWRHGRCVVVPAPDYNAETPIETLEQEKRQHEETVDVDSETSFSVKLRHRFDGGNVSAPIMAELTSGKEKLEPDKLEGGSGTLKYKAPTEEDKTATARIRSVSKRGIGTLVLEFKTGGGLTLTISGSLNGLSQRIGTVRITDTVNIGPVVFKKLFDDMWEGTGEWTARSTSVTTVIGTTQTCTGTQRGTVTWLASTEKRGDKNVWVLNGLDATAEGTGTSSCEGEIFIDGDIAGIFLGMLDQIVIPREGGRVPVRGSQTVADSSWNASGTAEAKTGGRR
jgi:hypothetical protein